MKLRIVSAVLWFVAAWVVVGGIAYELGLNQAVGALVGVAWAAFVVIDPKDLIWRVGVRSATASQAAGSREARPGPQVGTGS